MKKKYFTEEERKAARKEQKRKWDEEHREKKREQDRRWKNTHKEERKKYNEQYYNTLIGRANLLINHYIRADKESNRICDELPEDYVDSEWVMEEIQKGCTYKDKCGTTDWKKTGLNRIDITLPHTKDNCEPCCWECNKRIEYERKKKPVDQIDPLTNEIVASYSCLEDAANAIGAHHSNISSCCYGKRNTVKGYIWKFQM